MTVFMFPGQSSRYPGMLDKLVGLHRPNARVLAEASEVLGRDLARHYRAENTEAFATNKDIQIGVFVANHMFLQVLEAAGIEARASLGLSLGEWNHLVHIRALPFTTALRAVEQRGALYDAGARGSMASVFPIDLAELEEVVERAAQKGVVEVVNLNSPRQHVISGETAAVDEALRLLEDECFVQGVVIERQVPMHSSLFDPVGERFRAFLETVPFGQPALPYLPNRLARLLRRPSQEQFVELLSTHVCRPVRWRESVDLVRETWPNAVLVEVGPKAVLHNLLDRKWHKTVTKLRTDSADDTPKHLADTVSQLQALQGLRGQQRTRPAARHVI